MRWQNQRNIRLAVYFDATHFKELCLAGKPCARRRPGYNLALLSRHSREGLHMLGAMLCSVPLALCRSLYSGARKGRMCLLREVAQLSRPKAASRCFAVLLKCEELFSEFVKLCLAKLDCLRVCAESPPATGDVL